MSAVIILGAGASKACDGPQTNDILPRVLDPSVRVDAPSLNLLESFLTDYFGLPAAPRERDDFPSLPMILSFLDAAIDRKEAVRVDGRTLTPEQLAELRLTIAFGIAKSAGTWEGMRKPPNNDRHQRLFETVYPEAASEPVVISLNYDELADRGLVSLGRARYTAGPAESWVLPDYGTEIFYDHGRGGNRPVRRFGRLLKLHGSLNWLYCRVCHRLQLGRASRGPVLDILYDETTPFTLEAIDADRPELERVVSCADCQAKYTPVLVAPTHLKDYRNPHVGRIWYEASRALREASRVIFIGYSLPEDDQSVIYLLKRSIDQNCSIEVIEWDPQEEAELRGGKPSPVLRRYQWHSAESGSAGSRRGWRRG
jgi:hypothetical protein